MNPSINSLTNAIIYYFLLFLLSIISLACLGIIFYGLILWWRWRKREEQALKFVLLQIALPRDNEIKIDAMEQIFASLYSIKSGGKFKFFRTQPHVSFEIVSANDEIRFYISCPQKFRELIERQIQGGYPEAEIKEVEEYNIFSEKGKPVLPSNNFNLPSSGKPAFFNSFLISSSFAPDIAGEIAI